MREIAMVLDLLINQINNCELRSTGCPYLFDIVSAFPLIGDKELLLDHFKLCHGLQFLLYNNKNSVVISNRLNGGMLG